MTDAANTFIYVTYIRTTREKLWEALTNPEFNRQYWMGAHQESDWKAGSPWKIMLADGRIADSGEVLEIEPMKRVVLKWRNEFMPELKAEGFSRCTYAIEETDGVMKLTVTHEADAAPKLIGAVSRGWPQILSGLKSLLETGKGLKDAPQS
ncbi:MAG: SRPBCC family protein [Mesorhizobium sp.]